MHFVGSGKSTNRSARKAGEEAARQSVSGLRGGSAGLVLAFGTAGYDQAELLCGIQQVTGGAPLAGCSTSGVITREGSDESSYAVAVMALASDWLSFETYSARGLSSDPAACGSELASQVRRTSRIRGHLLLLFSDGLTGNVSELLRSLEADLPYPVAICGGAAGELLKTDRTWQYHDGKAESDTTSAVLVGGDVTPEIAVSHGCAPIGIERTITRAEGGWVHEIDGTPTWEVYRQYLDTTDIGALTMSHFCYLCLAERLPEPEPGYGDYVVRCPLRIDRRSGALFFPGTIEAGTRVRIALRDPEQTLARARASAASLVARRGNRPALVLQFDCCCRGRLLFGARTTQSSIRPVQELFAPETPWLGFHTYGEIAPLPGRPALFHNYSMVLCALYRAAGAGR